MNKLQEVLARFAMVAVIFGGLYTVFDYSYAYAHETVHKTVYDSYNVNSTINITFNFDYRFPFPDTPFKAETVRLGNTSHLTAGERNAMEYLHLQNEIFGYQLLEVNKIAGMILILILLLVFENRLFPPKEEREEARVVRVRWQRIKE